MNEQNTKTPEPIEEEKPRTGYKLYHNHGKPLRKLPENVTRKEYKAWKRKKRKERINKHQLAKILISEG